MFRKGKGPEIKLPIFIGSQRKEANSRKKKIYFCFVDYTKDFDCVDHNKLWKIFEQNTLPAF